MKLILNGKERDVSGETVHDVVSELNVSAGNSVVEVNGQIVNKDDYSRFLLKENDRLEIVRFVGGG